MLIYYNKYSQNGLKWILLYQGYITKVRETSLENSLNFSGQEKEGNFVLGQGNLERT